MRHFLAILLLLIAPATRGDDLFIFTRPGCSPCQRLKETLESDQSLTEGFTVYMIDTSQTPGLAAKRGVKAVPVLVVERAGREVARKVGYENAVALRQWLQEQKK